MGSAELSQRIRASLSIIGIRERGDETLEVGDQVVVVEVMGSGQRSILRCEAANTAAGTSTILAK